MLCVERASQLPDTGIFYTHSQNIIIFKLENMILIQFPDRDSMKKSNVYKP